MTLSVARIGNLFYQLECLAGRLRCSEEAYRSLWEGLGFGAAGDAEMLERFASTLEVYDTRARLGPRPLAHSEQVSPFGPEVVDIGPRATENLNLLSRIRVAAYGSDDRESLRQRLSLLMHTTDVAVIDGAIEHFGPRFEGWLEDNQVSSALVRFFEELTSLLESGTADFIDRVAQFYGLEEGMTGEPIFVHIMAHPLEQAATNGMAIENHAVIEVLSGEAAERRLAVIVHEITHRFFATAPIDFHRERLEGAWRAADPRASAALSLMNETFATAIGNGLLEQRLRGDEFQAYFESDESFYASADVDAAAKALLPLIRDYIHAGRSMDRQFVDRYFALVLERLGQELDSVAARLRVSAFVASDRELAAAAHELPRLLSTTSLYGSTLASGDSLADSVLYRHSYLNGVVLTAMEDRAKFTALDARIAGIRGTCTIARDSGAILYVVVRDRADLAGAELVSMLHQAQPCGGSGEAQYIRRQGEQ